MASTAPTVGAKRQRPVSAICAIGQQKSESSKLSFPLRGDRGLIKETRLLPFKPRIVSATLALLVMGLVTVAVGQGTLDDQQAVREFAAANPDIVFMQRVRGQEIFRIVNGGTGQPSPEVAKLMNPAAPVPKVDDPHVPLHLRIVEL
jgi:hypothetical protein